MYKLIKVYTIHRRNDDRVMGPITDICATESLAVTVAKGAGWHGGDAPVIEHAAVQMASNGAVFLLHPEAPEQVTVAHSVTEIRTNREHKEKIEALAKLSPRERQLLGLG